MAFLWFNKLLRKAEIKNGIILAFEEFEKGRQTQARRVLRRYQKQHSRSSAPLLEGRYFAGDENFWRSKTNEFLAEFSLAPISNGLELDSLTTEVKPGSVQGPLVTVIMAVYNSEKTLDYAIRSLVNQSYSDLEILIRDDASTDGTYGIAAAWAERDKRVKVWRNSVNVGCYVTRNILVGLAKGKYITGHDGDDWAHPERIARQVQSLVTNKRLAGMAMAVRVEKGGLWAVRTNKYRLDEDPLMDQCAISAIYEADFFRKSLGAWDCVKFGADRELNERARAILKDGWDRQPFVAMFMLQHSESLTGSKETGFRGGLGANPLRGAFRKEYLKWHSACAGTFPPLEFPPKARHYEAPEAMLVPLAKIQQVVSELPWETK